MSDSLDPTPSQIDLSSYWMPFTPNRMFKSDPRMIVSAQGVHYTTADGRQILDGVAGLWCCNAGHNHPRIVDAIRAQAGELDYACAFNLGHPKAFELANRLAEMTPEGLNHIFFSNSGSEAVETALKVAIAYHRARGEGSRTRLIGREKAYHGVNFGGISVGGILPVRKSFGHLLPGVDHLPHTHNLDAMAFSRGQPDWGAHLADDLERIIALHDASTIAAVIVEPVSGSAGVLVPPKGYLRKLREITEKVGILLIFDEVITGFGRVGDSFASQLWDITPDMITMAKGLTGGAVPMGATAISDRIYQAFMRGEDHLIELFHGYTYSGHPLAAAAGLATLDVYQKEGLFDRAAELAPYFEQTIHSLRDHPHVVDVRNIGLMGAIELAPRKDGPTLRAWDVFHAAWEDGVMVRITGETVALTPPLTITRDQIDQLVGAVGQALMSVN